MRSFTSVFGVLAAAITAVSAYTNPVGNPTGNDIHTPGLHQVVPAGKPFEITWKPTTAGTITLVLLRGPSTNAVPQYAIVEKIANSGKYSWTPSTALVPDVSNYGIQLIDDVTGQYQYSTQFGISNGAYVSSSSSSVKATSTSAPVYSSSTSAPVYTATSTPVYVSSAAITKTSTTSSCTATTLTTSCSSTTSAAPHSTYVPHNSTAATSTPTPAPYTGAASGNAVQFGMVLFAGAVGAFAAIF